MTPEPRVVVVKRYRCAFCPRGYSVRKRCVEHMEHCMKAPDYWHRHVGVPRGNDEADGWGDEF